MYCQMTIKVTNRGEAREVWFTFESAENSLEAIFEKMKADGAVCGSRMETSQLAPKVRQVIDSFKTIISRDSIVSISELQFDLIGQNGETLFALTSSASGAAA